MEDSTMERTTRAKTKLQIKQEQEALELMHRQFQAKCRFRACVRKVIASLYWLTENEEIYEGDNVKKRVVQAMRVKKHNLLSLTDKALLNKPVSERTEAEKKYIFRKIGGLKCFKRYPNHVKMKLAAATYFKYYGPNRVIVRQNQEAEALYFIITGEVIVSVLVWDAVLNKQQSVNVFVMHPGDMFGEVSLLHNIKRTATCTTSGHCEFLALMKQDFKEVLQKSLEKLWDNVRNAMKLFTYFDELDEVARREGCIVAKMKSFEPNETIIGDGVGLSNFVYFVLSGHCQMIESLQIECTKMRNKKKYILCESCKIRSKNKNFESRHSFEIQQAKIKSYIESEQSSIQSKNESKIKTDEMPIQEKTASSHEMNNSGSKEKCLSVDKKNCLKKEVSQSINRQNTKSSFQEGPSQSGNVKAHDEPKELSQVLLQDKINPAFKKSSCRFPVQRNCSNPKCRTYFMQVCIFNAGSTFGFGENMCDRRIIATTKVDCMMLPLTWLMQKNIANIWSRIQHYLEKKIPTKNELFQHFVSERRWVDWRDAQVSKIVAQSKSVNHTTIHDVPYSIRIQEMRDI